MEYIAFCLQNIVFLKDSNWYVSYMSQYFAVKSIEVQLIKIYSGAVWWLQTYAIIQGSDDCCTYTVVNLQ